MPRVEASEAAHFKLVAGLEGVEHHSATGVMKAHWDSTDYNQMLLAPLVFAAEDLEMIRRGLEAREARAKSGSPAL